MVALRGRLGRERLKRHADAFREAAALGVGPALEIRQPIDEEAVEESTTIDRDRGPQIPVRERVFEPLDVAREDRRIEPLLRGTEE